MGKIVITQAVNVNKSNVHNGSNSNSQTIIGKVIPSNGTGYSQLTASIRGSFNSNRSINANQSAQTTSTTDYGVNINNTHPNIGNTTTNYNYTQTNHNYRSNSQNNKLKNKDINSTNGVHKVHNIINGNRIDRIDSNIN